MNWRWRHWAIVIVGLFFSIWLFFLSTTIFFQWQAYRAYQNQSWPRVVNNLRRVQPFLRGLNIVTFDVVPDFRVWQEGVELSLDLFEWWRQNQENVELPDLLSQLLLAPETLFYQRKLAQIINDYQQTWWLRRAYPLAHWNWPQFFADWRLVRQEWGRGEHRLLILLQNTQELRPAGGFMGSFLLVTWRDGRLIEWYLDDIYQPAGQVKLSLDPPPGVKEYLSGGNNWQLSDANWHPDFSLSARRILDFFASAGYQDIQSVAAVNLAAVERVIDIIGPIYLVDYQVNLTAENLSALARADRGSFFPGSKQKPQFLNHALRAIVAKLKIFDLTKTRQLTQAIFSGLQNKDIQLFDLNQEIEQIWRQRQWAGVFTDEDNFLALIEANVGINKANKKIEREFVFDFSSSQLSVKVVWQNRNHHRDRDGDRHLNYVNYQRLFLPLDYQVQNLAYQGRPITDYQKRLIENSQGQTIQEIGFLVVVPEETRGELAVRLNLPKRQIAKIKLYKQSGIPISKYTALFANGKQETGWWRNDFWLMLPQFK